ncbi:MAG: hypothetical protein CTY16_03820 [Methylobacter sp.]|nr:MAG: hypothetical protein CTY16_03820 [Methylobacter sp.]
MQVNNMRKEHQNTQDRQANTSLSVCVLGFGVSLEEKLKQLFQQQPLYKNSYRLVPPTDSHMDVLLVNYDNPLALRKKDLLLNSLSTKPYIVAVSQGPLDKAPPYHIRGMLTAGRLMAVLASIPAPAGPSATLFAHPTLAITPKPELAPAPVPVANVTVLASKPRYRALVVDDSLAIQKSLELKLSALEQISGIDFAENGTAALAMADANHYDVIFLDVMMPGIDGYETCTRLRSNPRYKKTPIIMVSGKTSPLDEVKGVMAGCTTYLTKPVQDEAFQKLSVRVLAWLTARQPQEQGQRENANIVRH